MWITRMPFILILWNRWGRRFREGKSQIKIVILIHKASSDSTNEFLYLDSNLFRLLFDPEARGPYLTCCPWDTGPRTPLRNKTILLSPGAVVCLLTVHIPDDSFRLASGSFRIVLDWWATMPETSWPWLSGALVGPVTVPSWTTQPEYWVAMV